MEEKDRPNTTLRPETIKILDVPLSTLNMEATIALAGNWAAQGDRGRTLTFTNVHMVTEAFRNLEFRRMLETMDLNCLDGVPLVWLSRYITRRKHLSRTCGPDFMPAFCLSDKARGLRHFFYGAGPGVAEAAIAALRQKCPDIQIAGHYSPPFRPLSTDEIADVRNQINSSNADVLWVSLGCPKQERWIYENRAALDVKLLLAVGQAFDILAGTRQRAPKFIREHGLEWLYRLARDPRRLWKRYLIYNWHFLRLIFREHAFVPRTNAP